MRKEVMRRKEGVGKEVFYIFHNIIGFLIL